jgi:hypothetical protein
VRALDHSRDAGGQEHALGRFERAVVRAGEHAVGPPTLGGEPRAELSHRFGACHGERARCVAPRAGGFRAAVAQQIDANWHPNTVTHACSGVKRRAASMAAAVAGCCALLYLRQSSPRAWDRRRGPEASENNA